MSGISGAAASAGSTSTVGTDLAPITFPGISSGIDYNSIITKLTSLTLAPNTQYNNQITQLNAKNAELIKINGLLASVQSTLGALSNPQTFNAYSGTSTDPVDAGVTQLANGIATPGTYSIQATHVATATAVTGGSTVGVTMNVNTALISAGTAITPTNGTNGQQGQITVDGVAILYDVNSQSLNTIVSHIYASVSAVDSGFSIATGTNGQITISSTDEQISLGSAGDNGNLEAVLKLDTAQVNNSGPPNSVTSAGPVGGVNLGTPLLSADHAGFATAVTSGTFTINGVQISVNYTPGSNSTTANDNVASVLAKINSSTAGVVASYDMTSGKFSITNATTGSQSIVLGSSRDTSNFLVAAQLTPGTGAVTTVGKQAYVAVLSNSGTLSTVYSNSNAVAGVIPGMAINVSGSTTLPFTVTVAQNTAPAISAISTFVSVYNAALNEIAIATAPPVVQQNAATKTSTTSTSSVLASGGILYGDETIQNIQSQLTQFVTGLTQNGSGSYNSLASIGLSLDTSHTVYSSNVNSYGGAVNTTQSGPIATTSADGTDGQFLPLDVAKFTAAFAADPSAVTSLFTPPGSSLLSTETNNSSLTYQIGAYLTGVTGSPSSLLSGLVGTIPAVSLLQGDENQMTAQISTLNKSIQDITNKANAQADLLRSQATASEALISKYQSEQSAVNQLSGSSSSSS